MKNDMERTKDFVAVSVKTIQATARDNNMYSKLPIHIALLKYKDGKPCDEGFSRYVNPPVDAPWQSMGKDGLTSDDCRTAEEFPQLFPLLKDYTEDLPLVVFQHPVVNGAFREACRYYGLANPFHESRYIDPYLHLLIKYRYPIAGLDPDLSGLARWVMCFDLDRSEWIPGYAPHDAAMLAELYLRLQETDAESCLPKKEPNAGWFSRKAEQKDESLFGDPIPEEEVIHPDNPLNRKYVCLTGFDCEVENAVNRKLMFLGAGRLDGVKSRMDILVPSPKSMQKYGFPPKGKIADALKKKKQVMQVDELREILQAYGVYEGELDGLI